MGFTVVTLAGTYKKQDGSTNATGTVTFKLNQALKASDTNQIIAPNPVTATLSSGAFSTSLVATTDPTTLPQNGTYHVTEVIDGVTNEYDIVLSHLVSSQQLADIMPVELSPSFATVPFVTYLADVDGIRKSLSVWRQKAALYYPAMGYGADTTLALTLNQMMAAPLIVPRSQSFDQIAAEVTTLGASSVLRMGIYADNGNGYPGALVVDAGTVSAATTGAKTISISQIPNPGLYWLALVAQTAVCTVRSRNGPNPFLGQSVATTQGVTGYEQASVSGALPSTFSGTVTPSSNTPKIMLRAA